LQEKPRRQPRPALRLAYVVLPRCLVAPPTAVSANCDGCHVDLPMQKGGSCVEIWSPRRASFGL